MIQIRKSSERGHFDHGWLDTRHTFSFADYFDPRYVQFRDLRVINEDRVAPGQGFPTHGHRDMEIVTYVLSGALEHKDSLGNGSVIRRGDVQRMSAGTGVRHSEFNASKIEPVHLLQIWILPKSEGLAPGYEQARIDESARRDKLAAIASPAPLPNAVKLHQDVEILSALLSKGREVVYSLKAGRHAWVQAASGELDLNGEGLAAGDGASVSAQRILKFRASSDSEFLLFDLA